MKPAFTPYPYDVEVELQKVWIVSTPSEALDLCDYLFTLNTVVAVDTEADDINPKKESPVGKGFVVTVQVAWVQMRNGKALPEDPDAVLKALKDKKARVFRAWVDVRDVDTLDALKPWLESDKPKVLHNVGFDYHILRNAGITMRGVVADTLAMSRLHDPERMSHALDGQLGLVQTILGDTRLTTTQALNVPAIGKNGRVLKRTVWPGMLAAVEDDEMRPYQQVYSTFDVYDTVRILYHMASRLRSLSWMDDDERGLLGYWEDMGCDYVTRVLPNMERQGIAVDEDLVDQLTEVFTKNLADIETTLWRWAGSAVNFNSYPQKSHLLYGTGLKVIGEKKAVTIEGKGLPYKGKEEDEEDDDPDASTDKAALSFILSREEVMEEDKVAIRLLLERSKLSKLVTATLHPMKRNLRSASASGVRKDGSTKYIHGSFAVKAATGRLASSNPNMQNIPTRSLAGKQIRHAFVCEPWERLVVCDYSQLELRILAWYAFKLFGDLSLWEAIEAGDVHQATADELGVSRDIAKSINFGVVYGMGAYKLATTLGITEGEAQEILDKFFRIRPGISLYSDWVKDFARVNGFVTTLLGRYRFLPDIRSRNRRRRSAAERRAMNTPIQGSAQDIVALAMKSIVDDKHLRRLRYKLRLQVHDELVGTCLAEHAEEALDRKTVLMSSSLPKEVTGKIRFDVAGHTGVTWAEAKDGTYFECPRCAGKGKGCEHCDGEGELKDWKE